MTALELGHATAVMTIPADLGCPDFRRDHGTRAAYVAGAMYKGIASVPLVVRMGRAGLLGFFGAGGLPIPAVEAAILTIRGQLRPDDPWGVNVVCDYMDGAAERRLVELLLRLGVTSIEASAFMAMRPSIVHYRVAGLTRDGNGGVIARNRLMAKVSKPRIAGQFLAPPPADVVAALLTQGKITPEQAELARDAPMADDICVEADSAGHTDRGVAQAVVPVIRRIRDRAQREHGYPRRVRVGTGGGLGTPESVAAAFMLGADFVLTGSVNQCTVEAGTSDTVKDLLAGMALEDTAYAPAGDLFELGSQVQVLAGRVLFPARARALHTLWKQHASLESIPPATAREIQTKWFRRSFAEAYSETERFYRERNPAVVEQAERDAKHRMALVFRWYFVHSLRLALAGDANGIVNFQVHCGPAMGSFNQWAEGSSLADWRHRHVDGIADALLDGAARLFGRGR
jgi:trans-AT polyketide synthase/acyltransferase/oxidoreductase domain-containing protein